VLVGYVSVTVVVDCLRFCQQAVLQCCTELIEGALRERLRNGVQEEKNADSEDERASTPTDLREIDF